VARYLDGKTEGRRAFVIGEEGLTSELKPLGMELVGPVAASRVDYVIVGWDREFDFNKLKAAVLAIRDGAHFIATNADATYPTPEGLWPGAGSIVAAVSTGSGQVPVVVGKPNPLIVEIALDRMASGPKETLLIGDRLDTDILSGIAAGIDTLLVLTGVSTPEEVNETGIRPTHVRDSLSAMLNG
jgi:4-nitrophenyl phosphatase